MSSNYIESIELWTVVNMPYLSSEYSKYSFYFHLVQLSIKIILEKKNKPFHCEHVGLELVQRNVLLLSRSSTFSLFKTDNILNYPKLYLLVSTWKMWKKIIETITKTNKMLKMYIFVKSKQKYFIGIVKAFFFCSLQNNLSVSVLLLLFYIIFMFVFFQ